MSDDRREVEMAVAAEENLPPPVLRALEAFLLIPSVELAFERLDALELVLQEWDECDSDADMDSWRWLKGNAAVTALRDADGVLRRTEQGEAGAELVPSYLVSLITVEILDKTDETRTRGIEGLREILAEWAPYFDDDEKLLGHMIRKHDDQAIHMLSHDELLARHAEQHAAETEDRRTR